MSRARHPPGIWAFREQYLFGCVDGLNGMVGLTIGLLRVHAATTIIFVALLSRAGSSSVSMAGAEYESDETSPTKKIRAGRVAAMGLGYLSSALIPGLGFAFSVRAGLAVFVPATIAVLFCITWFRSATAGWIRAGVTTAAIFALAVAAGLLASLAG